jgi:cyanophycinase
MKKSICAPGLLLTMAVLQACFPGETEGPDQGALEQGRLVIIGGGLQADNAAVYDAVVSARHGDGPLCVVPTASGDAPEAMNQAVRTLSGYTGEGAVTGVLITTENPERAEEPSVAAELATCSGFYFTGGSQSRIVDVFLPAGDTTAAYRALHRRWREGAVVSGTSAGAAMMSRLMISGGSSAEAVSQGRAATEDADGVQISRGMDFFEPLLDQHFLARGRIGRLLVAVMDDDLPQIGLGIDENTALVVDGYDAAVVGASGVVVVDGRAAVTSGPHHASGLTVSLAGAGDVLDLQTFGVRRDGTKSPVPVRDEPLEVPEDPFARWAFLHLLVDLAASEDSEATFSLSDATLKIVEAPGFTASRIDMGEGVQGTPNGFSAGPFRVDLSGPGS